MCPPLYYRRSCLWLLALFFALTCVLTSALTANRNISVTATTSITSNHHKTVGPNHVSAGRRPTTASPHAASTTEEDGSQEDDDDDEDGEEDTADGSSDSDDSDEDKNCTCSGSNCVCCTNLNLSFIDLEGSGCVKFAYVPDNDTLAVNMTYGGRLLESDTIKRTSSDLTCMDLFSDLAQMCAKFIQVTKVASGVKGCVSVEPMLLGVAQSSYDVGCFNMDIEGVQPQPQATKRPVTSSDGTKESSTEEDEEEELASAISQSAAEGFNWFNNFITSVFSEDTNETSPESVQPHFNRTNSNNVKPS